MKKFFELPCEVQYAVKETLKAYDEVPVVYENGRYEYGCCIHSDYPADHEFIGVFYAKDVFTEEERILNYVNCFHAFPPIYHGLRDYSLLKDFSATYKLVNGNIVLA